jgi:hypothetical protein
MLNGTIRTQDPIKLSAEDKLNVLRQLDRWRSWNSLQDKRFCLVCGHLLSGREIEVVGGTREQGPLRLHCPTENCPSIPMDWVLPSGQQSATALPARVPAAAMQRARPFSTRASALATHLRNVMGPIRKQSITKSGKQKKR